jgi:hypothetical protein
VSSQIKLTLAIEAEQILSEKMPPGSNLPQVSAPICSNPLSIGYLAQLVGVPATDREVLSLNN